MKYAAMCVTDYSVCSPFCFFPAASRCRETDISQLTAPEAGYRPKLSVLSVQCPNALMMKGCSQFVLIMCSNIVAFVCVCYFYSI